MKHLSITAALFGTLLVIPGSAQSQEAPKATPVRIMFFPKKMLEGSKLSGKLEPNVFYWTNIPDDPAQGPKVAFEDGHPFLHLKSSGTEITTKEMTVVTLYRVFAIPADSHKVTITLQTRRDYNEWAENEKNTPPICSMTYSFLKNGKEARKNSQIIPPTKDELGWKTITATATIPEGAQQLPIVIKTGGANTIDIAGMDVQFEK